MTKHFPANRPPANRAGSNAEIAMRHFVTLRSIITVSSPYCKKKFPVQPKKNT